MSNIEQRQQISGADFAKSFHPLEVQTGEVRLEGISADALKVIADGTRKAIYRSCESGQITGKVLNNKGVYIFEGEAVALKDSVCGAIASVVAHPDVVRLPELRPEMIALPDTLVESLSTYDGRVSIIAPACPDYGKGERFYRAMGEGISAEAQGAINAATVIAEGFSQAGFNPEISILIANTEFDIPDIMQNVVEGEVVLYQQSCERTAEKVRKHVEGQGNVTAMTFTDFLGEVFHHRQYEVERHVREAMTVSEQVKARLQAIAAGRVARHSQILGRDELAHELTVRYVSQYMALGSIMRKHSNPSILLNYPTPNRAFFNAFANIHPLLKLPGDSEKVVPVMGTIVKRE